MSGEQGHRVLTPNTSILSHQWSWGSGGKEHELFSVVKEFKLNQKRFINHYKKCTGLDEETIREKLLPESDVWMTPQEAFNKSDPGFFHQGDKLVDIRFHLVFLPGFILKCITYQT